MNPITTLASKLAALAALTATGGLLAGVKIHLYQNAINPNPNMQLSDFVEATYGGYAAEAVGTWSAPYIAVDTLAHVSAPSLFFQATDAVTPNTVYGAYITNTAGTVLVYAAAFAQAVPMVSAGDGLWYMPDLIYGA